MLSNSSPTHLSRVSSSSTEMALSSPFNLLTAGGAKFDKKRFKRDFELFEKSQSKQLKGKGKQQEDDSFGSQSLYHLTRNGKDFRRQKALHDGTAQSDSEASASSSTARRPPRQKITLTGPKPLPQSLHANLPSLFHHPSLADSTPASVAGPLLSAIGTAGVHSLWGVQCAVGGSILDGKDTMCIAPTGSGKTLAYLLPTLVRLRDPARRIRSIEEGRGIRALILVPTHDLALQIRAVLKVITTGRAWRCMILSKATEVALIQSSPGEAELDPGLEDENVGNVDEEIIEGKGSSGDEENDGVIDHSLPLGIDFLITTPERLHHLVESKRLSLSSTRHLILDEADRLLSEDFRPQVEPILAACTHSDVQKTFLSATIPSGSEELAKRWLKDGGVRIVVGLKDSAVTTVTQSLQYAGSEAGKLMALRNLVASGDLPYPSLIFVQSVARADELSNTLIMDGLRVGVVHGEKAIAKRDEAIRAFREGRVWVLVVTEVLARGMDFRGVKMVVNYDFPQTTQSYVHRIGRAGRAGLPGRALTLFTDSDAPHLRTIANVLRASGCAVPEYMLEMRKPSKNEKKKVRKIPIKRKEVGGGGRVVGREMRNRKREMVEASKRRKQTVDVTE